MSHIVRKGDGATVDIPDVDEPEEVTLQAVMKHLERIDRKLNRMLALMGEGPKLAGVTSKDLRMLHGLTLKQHVAMQMVVHGASNREIAQVMGVTENTAKVHVRSLASKLGVNTRAQITAKMMPLVKDVSEEEYRHASGGLPKDWATAYAGRGTEDPYRELYRAS